MSNHNDDNNSPPFLFLGGAIAIAAIAGIALKAIETFLRQLSASFDAFGHAVSSFFPMLLKILEMVGLVAAITFATVAAVYFSIKYIKLVSEAMDLRKYLRNQLKIRFDDFREHVEKEYIDQVSQLILKVEMLEGRLTEFMKPASATSPITAAITEAAPSTNEEHENLDEKYDEEDPAANTAPEYPISNHY